MATPTVGARHTRDPSLRVTFSAEEVARLAQEIYDETVAEPLLTLFTLWICEDKEHYDQAKLHIRELALDQGYPTSRISNELLRKLLEEATVLRPRYANREYVIRSYSLARQHHPDPQPQPLSQGLLMGSVAGPSSRIALLPTLHENTSQLTSQRPPAYVANLPLSASKSGNSSIRSTPSAKLSMRADSLPSLNRGTAPWSATFSPNREFPPNTPDRPAPLNFKSRSSSAGTGTPKTALLRSVSSPVRMRQAALALRSTSVSVTEATSSLANLVLEEELAREASSVYSSDNESTGNYKEGRSNGTNNLRSLFSCDEEDLEAFLGQERSERRGQENTKSPFDEDAKTDIGSVCESDLTAVTQSPESRHTRSVSDTVPNRLESSCLPYQVNHRNSDQSISASSQTLVQTRYVPKPKPNWSPLPFVAGPVPTAEERRAAAQARRLAQRASSNVLNSGSSIDRPLPFRNIMSETTGSAEVDRASGSPIRLHRAGKSTSTNSSHPASSISSPSRRRRYDTPASNGTSSSSLDRALPHRHYADSDALFPQFHRHLLRSATQPGPARRGNEHRIEGVTELTMRVGPNALRPRGSTPVIPQFTSPSRTSSSPSRSTLISNQSSSQGDASTSSTASLGGNFSVTPDTLTDAYKNITAAYITNALQRTRARGAVLPAVRWSTLDSSEVVWRVANEDLIERVYGRTDIVLSEVEKDFVNKIAAEMKEGVGSIEGHEWVKALLQG